MKLKDVYKHILTGVGYMIPVICLGGILQSFGTMLGGSAVTSNSDTFAYLLYNGGSLAMSMVVPTLAAYTAYSICDRPGIAPGFMIGLMSVNYKIGFIGGIVGGLLVGYFIQFVKEKLPLPSSLKSLLPLLILPIFGGLFSIILMEYVLGPVLGGLQQILINLFTTMTSGSKVLFGIVLGVLMGVDLGGPVTKAGTTVANGLVADGIIGPEGAKVCIGCVAPIALGLSALIEKKKYTKEEKEQAISAIILGTAQVGEGGLPFLIRDPLHVMPATIIGSAVTGAIAMYFNVGSAVMMGGFFAFPVMENVWPGAFLAIGVGVIVTMVVLHFTKKEIKDEAVVESSNDDFEVNFE